MVRNSKTFQSFLQNKLAINIDEDTCGSSDSEEFKLDDMYLKPSLHEEEEDVLAIDEKSLQIDLDKFEEEEEEEEQVYRKNEDKGPIGGSDEQILKDMRKTVFSIPLLHQEDVDKLFAQIDGYLFPIVYSILNVSLSSFEEIILVLSKVAAGNTYGKNIYEKKIGRAHV